MKAGKNVACLCCTVIGLCVTEECKLPVCVTAKMLNGLSLVVITATAKVLNI